MRRVSTKIAFSYEHDGYMLAYKKPGMWKHLRLQNGRTGQVEIIDQPMQREDNELERVLRALQFEFPLTEN